MSKNTSPYSGPEDQMLMTELWDPAIADDLVAFVKFVFPWGKEGTPLEKFKSPRTWQIDELHRITEHIRKNKILMLNGKTPEIYRSATASGRGVGKSALVAWLNIWMLSTRLGSTAINAANTEAQLLTRTWAELGKWHTLAINRHWFDKQALSLKPKEWFSEIAKKETGIDNSYYYSMAQLWSEETPEAFAGVHNQYATLLVYDEASGIPETIWQVSEGFFTDIVLDRYWLVFSNPRRNTGRFFQCFNEFRDYWKCRNLDSRDVEGADNNYLNEIIAAHGEDSDAARVEVKGEFPRQGDRQFISTEIVKQAIEREIQRDDHAALMMGVDPARFGDDATVIRFRQGRDARSIPPIRMKGKDNMEVANICAELIQKYNPDAVCIDAGNGTGIIDRLREMKYKVHEVWFGSKSDEEEWSNKRTELWARLREWLKGGCIPNEKDLIKDLSGPQYKFMGASDKIMLESKEDMKKRGFHSPDDADALACTFAIKVAHRDLRASKSFRGTTRIAKDVDYNPFG